MAFIDQWTRFGRYGYNAFWAGLSGRNIFRIMLFDFSHPKNPGNNWATILYTELYAEYSYLGPAGAFEQKVTVSLEKLLP